MCGIVAYLGKKKKGADVVVDGLKKLEYRGYDSWGIATKDDGEIHVHKQVGKVGGIDSTEVMASLLHGLMAPSSSSSPKGRRNNNGATTPSGIPRSTGGTMKQCNPTSSHFLENSAGQQGASNNLSICIGHTRWATHGGVTQKNAHPHSSCDGNIVLVHNGIIENYQELRANLEQEGHKFVSETDTEIIAHLIEKHLDKMDHAKPVNSAGYEGHSNEQRIFAEAVRSALLELQGNFALAVLYKNEDILIGARKGSPLILGLGKDEFFLASDAPAFIDHTRKVVYLDEDEMVLLKDGEWEVRSVSDGKTKTKLASRITWNAEEAQKGGFDHYLIKEINEQPRVIAESALTSKKDIEKAVAMIKAARHIYLVACGTAMHAGMSAQYLFSEISGYSTHLISAAEFHYFKGLLSNKDLVITISQSGETADVLEAVRATKQKGAKVLALVNVMGSSLMRIADYAILTKAGPEICVLSTKAYSSQVSTLLLLAYALAEKLEVGKVLLNQSSCAIKEILLKNNLEKIRKLAKRLSQSSDMYLIGRGVNYPTSLEAALKIKEVSYIHAEGFAGGDLKHGPIALIESGTPCFVFVAKDQSEKEILSNAMEIKARGGYIIGVGPEDNEIFDTHLTIPNIPLASLLLNIVPAQIFSYYLALERKCDPDKPRNLAKSVTVK